MVTPFGQPHAAHDMGIEGYMVIRTSQGQCGYQTSTQLSQCLMLSPHALSDTNKCIDGICACCNLISKAIQFDLTPQIKMVITIKMIFAERCVLRHHLHARPLMLHNSQYRQPQCFSTRNLHSGFISLPPQKRLHSTLLFDHNCGGPSCDLHDGFTVPC
jgi:hypothetical protein